MFSILIFSLVAVLSSVTNSQSNNGQYTPWTPSTTDYWTPTPTTTDYWTPTTTSDYWTPTTTSDYWTTETTPYYDWTSYTTVTSCYTENGLVVTITTWIPCPCDGDGSDTTIITEPNPIGTTTETDITTITPAYSTFTSNGVVYVVPLSTPVTATASAGVEIVNASDASKSTEIEGWIGVLSAIVLGSSAMVAVLL